MTDDQSGVRPPTFSERHGYEPYPPPIQLTEFDDRTRTDLWNFVYTRYLSPSTPLVGRATIWTGFLGCYQNEYNFQYLKGQLQKSVTDPPFNKVLDLVEFLLQRTGGYDYQQVATALNDLLAKNRVGYRLNIAEAVIIPITNKHELEAIETAAHSESSEVQNHLRAAVQLFADRDNPQWAKSISESISAVEAAARAVVGKQSVTLEQALVEIQNSGKAELHKALIDGWRKLYAFTSDSGGIRHALKEGTLTPTPEMAQYFLVTCSAFVNLLASFKAT
jgi:hypothetical protein